MKNGVYFILIALLIAELLKILIYANQMSVTSQKGHKVVQNHMGTLSATVARRKILDNNRQYKGGGLSLRWEKPLELDLTKIAVIDTGNPLKVVRFLKRFSSLQLRCQALPAYRQAKTATMKSTPKQEMKRKKKLRRIPLKVRAITCKNYLLKIYSQHANFLNAI